MFMDKEEALLNVCCLLFVCFALDQIQTLQVNHRFDGLKVYFDCAATAYAHEQQASLLKTCFT